MSFISDKISNQGNASLQGFASSTNAQNDADGFLQALMRTATKTSSPADSGFQTGDFKWNEKDLVSYYDLNKNGIVEEEDINEGLIKPKDINHDGVFDLEDCVKAFTMAISMDEEPKKYQAYVQVAKKAFKLKDQNNDGVVDVKDWDTDNDNVVTGKELMKKMDLNNDGVFTAEDTKVRQQAIFGET